VRWLFLTAALPCAGFGLAHFLHLAQVAGVNWAAGMSPSKNSDGRPLNARASQIWLSRHCWKCCCAMFTSNPDISGVWFWAVIHICAMVLILRGPHFGPFMIAAIAAALPVLFLKQTQVTATTWRNSPQISWAISWPGPTRPWPALAAALFVSLVWWPVMAAHVAGNSHVTVRHLFVFYLFLVLVVVKSISVTKKAVPPGCKS